MLKWLIARLREPSTIRGLVWILTVCGVLLTPEQTEAIVLAGMALAGLLGVFLADDSKTVDLANSNSIPQRVRELPPEYDPKIDGHGFGDK